MRIEYHRLGTSVSLSPVTLRFTKGELKKARHVFDVMAKRVGLIDSSSLSDEMIIAFMFTYGVESMLKENKGKDAE